MHDVFLAASAKALTALCALQTISLQILRIVTNLLPIVIEKALLAFIWIFVRGIDVSTVLVECLRFRSDASISQAAPAEWVNEKPRTLAEITNASEFESWAKVWAGFLSTVKVLLIFCHWSKNSFPIGATVLVASSFEHDSLDRAHHESGKQFTLHFCY